jgi:hypothetical protein
MVTEPVEVTADKENRHFDKLNDLEYKNNAQKIHNHEK